MSTSGHVGGLVAASMKAPPKRKGNWLRREIAQLATVPQ